MLAITPALGLLCLLFGLASTGAASPARITKRSFNPRQKWQSDEINCVQILNPVPGASYSPGYFVRMIYGTGQCNGATAAGPWTIHLYNNPEIQGENLRYDYHEVLADGIKKGDTQYTWNIPADQLKSQAIKKANEYYVRIETNSNEGVKLVGNAGPFSINSRQIRRREDPSADKVLKAGDADTFAPNPVDLTA